MVIGNSSFLPENGKNKTRTGGHGHLIADGTSWYACHLNPPGKEETLKEFLL